MVAMKKIGSAFDNYMDAKRTLREIKLIRHLDHDNVLSHRGYYGAAANVWSCGIILYVLMAGYLLFDETDLPTLHNKVQYLIAELNEIFSDETVDEAGLWKNKLEPQSLQLVELLPPAIQEQLMLERSTWKCLGICFLLVNVQNHIFHRGM